MPFKRGAVGLGRFLVLAGRVEGVRLREQFVRLRGHGPPRLSPSSRMRWSCVTVAPPT